MPVTLAFDVYGTLIDTHGVVEQLRSMVGDKAQAFSQTWRDKQLEYAFRRGLMQYYEDFSICTRDALQFTCRQYDASLDDSQKQALLDSYRKLPAYDDVREGLGLLSGAGHRLFAFSNGTAEAVKTLLANADVGGFFLDVISVDELRSFKPNPAVYSHFLRRAGASACDAWLVSCNPFDVIGAISAGMRGAWLQRSAGQLYDPWGIEPTISLSSLSELESQLARFLASL
jgi:2-haloacid dehalogenase